MQNPARYDFHMADDDDERVSERDELTAIPEENSHDAIVVEVFRFLSAAFALVGGVGSLAVVIGYVHMRAYFASFGATWLTRELSIGQIATASLSSLLPLLLGCLYFSVAFRVLARSRRRRRFSLDNRWVVSLATLLCVAGFAGGLTVLKYAAQLRSGFFWAGFAGSMLMSGSAMFIHLSLRRLRDGASGRRRLEALSLLAWFIVFGLFATPYLTGAGLGRERLASSQTGSTCVTLRSESPNVCHPAIVFGAERVYYLGQRLPSGRFEIMAASWPEIRSVRPPATSPSWPR